MDNILHNIINRITIDVDVIEKDVNGKSDIDSRISAFSQIFIILSILIMCVFMLASVFVVSTSSNFFAQYLPILFSIVCITTLFFSFTMSIKPLEKFALQNREYYRYIKYKKKKLYKYIILSSSLIIIGMAILLNLFHYELLDVFGSAAENPDKIENSELESSDFMTAENNVQSIIDSIKFSVTFFAIFTGYMLGRLQESKKRIFAYSGILVSLTIFILYYNPIENIVL